MNQETWTAVDRYISDNFIPADAALEAALAASAAAGLPAIQVSAAQGKMLQLLAQTIEARRILELGTLGGYSTLWLARALPPDGRLVTLEYDPKHAAVAQANIAHAGLAASVDIRVGRAIDTLPQLVAENAGPFDLIFIDADKVSYPAYFSWTLKLSRPGTLIIADNVVRQGAVANPDSQDANVRGVQQFTKLVAAESRVSATTIQTVGAKGYDGFALVRVES